MSNPQRTSPFGTEIDVLQDDLERLRKENLAFIQLAPLSPEQAAMRAKNLDAMEVLMARIDELGSQPIQL